MCKRVWQIKSVKVKEKTFNVHILFQTLVTEATDLGVTALLHVTELSPGLETVIILMTTVLIRIVMTVLHRLRHSPVMLVFVAQEVFIVNSLVHIVNSLDTILQIIV